MGGVCGDLVGWVWGGGGWGLGVWLGGWGFLGGGWGWGGGGRGVGGGGGGVGGGGGGRCCGWSFRFRGARLFWLFFGGGGGVWRLGWCAAVVWVCCDFLGGLGGVVCVGVFWGAAPRRPGRLRVAAGVLAWPGFSVWGVWCPVGALRGCVPPSSLLRLLACWGVGGWVVLVRGGCALGALVVGGFWGGVVWLVWCGWGGVGGGGWGGGVVGVVGAALALWGGVGVGGWGWGGGLLGGGGGFLGARTVVVGQHLKSAGKKKIERSTVRTLGRISFCKFELLNLWAHFVL